MLKHTSLSIYFLITLQSKRILFQGYCPYAFFSSVNSLITNLQACFNVASMNIFFYVPGFSCMTFFVVCILILSILLSLVLLFYFKNQTFLFKK